MPSEPRDPFEDQPRNRDPFREKGENGENQDDNRDPHSEEGGNADSDIGEKIKRLVNRGMSNEQIADELGLDKDNINIMERIKKIREQVDETPRDPFEP